MQTRHLRTPFPRGPSDSSFKLCMSVALWAHLLYVTRLYGNCHSKSAANNDYDCNHDHDHDHDHGHDHGNEAKPKRASAKKTGTKKADKE